MLVLVYWQEPGTMNWESRVLAPTRGGRGGVGCRAMRDKGEVLNTCTPTGSHQVYLSLGAFPGFMCVLP